MSSGVYSQLYIQLVFSPHLYSPIQSVYHQERLYKFISGLLNAMGHKSLAINGMHDHIHIFFGLNPVMSISDVVKEVKRSSSRFIKEEDFMKRFNWQSGYGAFSYSRSHIDRVIKYIVNQKEHHRNKAFREEYLEMLDAFQISFKHQYLFEFHD